MSDIVERLDAAIDRMGRWLKERGALVSIPVHPTDVDVVLVEAKKEIERQRAVIEAARADRRWHHIGSCDCNLCNALRALDGGGDE